MQVYEGNVKDRVVLLPGNVHLDEGQRAEVRIRQSGQESPEELFRIRLVEVGLLEEIRRPSLPLPDQDRAPIQVKGKPLSEQFMEERCQVAVYYPPVHKCSGEAVCAGTWNSLDAEPYRCGSGA